jgi:TonB family protein
MKRLALSCAAASLALACALSFDAAARAAAAGRQQPEVLSAVVPFYPPIAKAARADGEVVVEVQTRADGSVASAAAVSGHPLLRQTAYNAALHWRFKPDVRGTTVRLTFGFRLERPAEGETETGSPYHVFIDRPREPDTINAFDPEDEGKTCELHGFKLERDKIRIVYGLLAFDAGHAEAQKTLFPHSNSWHAGGCEYGTESPKFAVVLHCRACRAVEEKWREEHRPPPDGR